MPGSSIAHAPTVVCGDFGLYRVIWVVCRRTVLLASTYNAADGSVLGCGKGVTLEFNRDSPPAAGLSGALGGKSGFSGSSFGEHTVTLT